MRAVATLPARFEPMTATGRFALAGSNQSSEGSSLAGGQISETGRVSGAVPVE